MSSYEKQSILTKKAENNNCSSYEISKVSKPQQHNLKPEGTEPTGRQTHNFSNMSIHNPITPDKSGMDSLIDQLNKPNNGEALDSKTRTNMEKELGYNFDPVRVHTDNYATNLTKALNAKATCYGQDIYFAKNQYNPNTQTGTTLLKHELNHYQQQNTTGTKIVQNEPDKSNNAQQQAIEQEEKTEDATSDKDIYTSDGKMDPRYPLILSTDRIVHRILPILDQQLRFDPIPELYTIAQSTPSDITQPPFDTEFSNTFQLDPQFAVPITTQPRRSSQLTLDSSFMQEIARISRKIQNIATAIEGVNNIQLLGGKKNSSPITLGITAVSIKNASFQGIEGHIGSPHLQVKSPHGTFRAELDLLYATSTWNREGITGELSLRPSAKFSWTYNHDDLGPIALTASASGKNTDGRWFFEGSIMFRIGFPPSTLQKKAMDEAKKRSTSVKK